MPNYQSDIRYEPKTLSKDSLIFKSFVSGSNFDVISNGITFKRNEKWVYEKFNYNIIKRNSNPDTLLKFYLDGSLVNW